MIIFYLCCYEHHKFYSMENTQKLNIQNNCLITPQYLRSLGHEVTPLNCKSLSSSQRPRDSHYGDVHGWHEMWDGPKQMLME